MNDIEVLEELLQNIKRVNENTLGCETKQWLKEKQAIENLLKERQSDKERIKELEEYANWHIEHISEDIADYIDDDRIGNKNIIGEFKEEREHWRDINRILNNEKTYIDYKTY